MAGPKVMRWWVAYKGLMRCNECGGAIPLSGPVETLLCPSCLTVIPMPPPFWEGFLEEGFRPGRSSGKPMIAWKGGLLLSSSLHGALVSRSWARALPRCPDCEHALPVDELSDQVTKVRCSRCPGTLSRGPAPGWLPTPKRIARALWGTQPLPTKAELPAGDQPIVFSCPVCAGALRVGEDTARVLRCEFCDADLYLPDDLWLRIHPARKRRTFWVEYRRTG